MNKASNNMNCIHVKLIIEELHTWIQKGAGAGDETRPKKPENLLVSEIKR